jgi:hypothetical protein
MERGIMKRVSDRSRKEKRQLELWGYFALSCSVCGGACYIHDLWNEASTFDFGLVFFFEVAMASAWIRLTSRILVEIEWNKYLVIPFFAPIAVLVFLQVMHPQVDGKALALIQIALVTVLAFMAGGMRKEMDASPDKGRSA